MAALQTVRLRLVLIARMNHQNASQSAEMENLLGQKFVIRGQLQDAC